MPIFRLKGEDISKAKLEIADKTNLELESYLEDWLENSPVALVQEPILWIGRQTSATVEDSTIFPDLLGLDGEGNLVIAELKRGQAPREVIAQLLEYAAWASELSEEQLQEIGSNYFQTRDEFQGKNFDEVFCETFETEEVPPLNKRLRLFLTAEEIPTRVAHVCQFLRTVHGMDITCISVSTFQTETGERLVSMEAKVGDEDLVTSRTRKQQISEPTRWSGDKKVREVILEVVHELTSRDPNVEFTLPEVITRTLEKYPNFNKRTARAQLYAACPNHNSYHGYRGDYKYYWQVEKRKYRLYDPERDKIPSSE